MPRRRRLDYHWNLRRVMAAHDLWKTTELRPLLLDRGVDLSAAQVYRLVTDKPERLSMKVLLALCDIFMCTPNDLITPFEVSATKPKAAGGDAVTVADLDEIKPERARITDPE